MNEDSAAQYRAVKVGCGLWRDCARGSVVLTGEDRVRLLNGLVTCEVKDLSPGQGVRGFFTEVKGHILAEVVVRAAEEHLWLDLPGSVADSIRDHIEKYIVADRVEVSPATQPATRTLMGPRAAELLEHWIGEEGALPARPWSHAEIGIEGHSVVLAADDHLGVPAFSIASLSGEIDPIDQALLERGASGGFREVGSGAVEALRIESGSPRFGIDYGPENLPQETGLDDAVSYAKGCYLGQEVVARLHYRGQAARCLRSLRAAAGDVPVPGSQLYLDDREGGVITSATRSPITEEIWAIAMLQRRALEEGTRLKLESGGEMSVV